MTEEQLQAIKMRAKYATDGPWKVVRSEESGVQIGTTWESGQLKACIPVVTTAHGVDGTTVYINHVNVEFIAYAREDVPALIVEVERLQQIEKGMEEEIKRLRDELEVIADHNIFKVPQITVRDYARKALKTKYRTPEQNALINKVIANLEELEGEKP